MILRDPCLEEEIDGSVIADISIIQATSGPNVYVISPTAEEMFIQFEVYWKQIVSHCNSAWIETSLEHEDGSQLDSDKFTYDSQSNELRIFSQDLDDVGFENFKLIAIYESSRDGEVATRQSELLFELEMFSECTKP